MPGALETEPALGVLPGAPRHELLARGRPPRAGALMSPVKRWAPGRDHELQGLCPPEARQPTEGRRGVSSLGPRSQGVRQALEVVQEALEQRGQGVRLVIGATQGVLGRWGQALRLQTGVQRLGRGRWHLRAPGLRSWVAGGWGQGWGAQQVQARVWTAAGCPGKGADPCQGPPVGVEKATLGAQAGKTRGLAKTAQVPGTGPQAPGLQDPCRRKMPLSGGPMKGHKPPGAGRGLQAERRLVGGKAQGSQMAKLQVLEEARLAAQGTQVSRVRGLLLGGRMVPPKGLGIRDAREPGRAQMVASAEKALETGLRGPRGPALSWAQDRGEEGAS